MQVGRRVGQQRLDYPVDCLLVEVFKIIEDEHDFFIFAFDHALYDVQERTRREIAEVEFFRYPGPGKVHAALVQRVSDVGQELERVVVFLFQRQPAGLDATQQQLVAPVGIECALAIACRSADKR